MSYFACVRVRFVRLLALLVFILSIGNAVQAQSAIALVQQNGKDAGTTTATSLSFTSPNTAGNWIAVSIRAGFSSSQVFSIHDSNGNAYQRAAQVGFTASAVTLAIFYAENIRGGANTIAISDTVSAPLRVAILEFSGVALSNSLDAAVAGTGTGSSPGTPSLTTTADGDLLLSAIATTNPATFAPDAGYAISAYVPAEPNTKLIAEEQIQSAAGPASASASINSSDSWGAVLVAVKPAGGTASTPPTITGLSPTSGPVGTSVTITGTNFGSAQDTTTVTFNGTVATPSSWSASSIVVPVPSAATSGNIIVTAGGVASNGLTFTVTANPPAPAISSLNPTSGPAGTSVTITGTNFGASQGTSAVMFNGTAASPTSWNSTSIVAPVPSGATSGNVVVTVGGLGSNGLAFTVTTAAPSITDLSPTSGPVGTSVTITGTNFGASQGTSTVMFNGTAASPTSWNSTSIVAPVPSGATSGNVMMTVGGVASNGVTFTVTSASTAPTITVQPADHTVVAGQTATFSVTATGTAPVSYQWNQDGSALPGATSASYTTPPTTSADDGAQFTVVVSNSAGSVTSNVATLTVTTQANTSSWTYVQDSIDTFCRVGASSCTIQTGTFLPTVPGSIWAVLLTTNNDVTISSVTGGGGTWTHCPNCHIYNSTLSRNEDIAYNLTGNAGTTSITVNLSGAASGQFGLNFVELIPPPGATASFDDAGTSSTTGYTTCTGVGLNITATDVIIQSVAATSPSTWNAWSAPYTTLPLGEGLNLNATSGAAPTVLTTGPGALFSAIAFKSTAGSFAPPTLPISVLNYTARQGINCSPSCSLSIPPTGSGHLLYIEAADMTSGRISSINGGGAWVVPTGSNTCQITLSGGYALSCGYVLSSNAGVVSLSVTMSGNTNASFAIWELASASGPFSFDVEGAATNNPSFDPSGVALALSGSNDVIFQSAFVPGGTSSVSFYPMPRVPPGGQGAMFMNANAASVVLLNTANGAAPLWVNQQNNATVVSAVAFSTPSR